MTIPAGTYAIDASHSEVGFTIRHAGIAKVRGVFNEFDGQIVVADDLATSSATATIKAASVDTGNEQRDGHLKSSDFFSIDVNPEWTFASTAVSFSGEEGTLTGDLTINGVTKPVTLEVEYNGAAKDAYGNDRIGFSAETELARSDFGITWNAPLEAGGLLLSDKVKIAIEISAVKQG
ncbi:polyisoprenoid-binding protein YceI [Salana multivorans]|uniref:Polyisoprenoid-binding protein YceI n=1 Tax=Salana multivorans TaxID=120377 RepID=A0A3N2D8J6_9MICO|nr:YceI family protein [Salana multivorans]OJX97516.1 MAG: polyisoprenoid-binding protein [Micrococcales bacterium 73-15]ROR96097.1 polyisoprenoid-binding protein YceI [Salana multivorans]